MVFLSFWKTSMCRKLSPKQVPKLQITHCQVSDATSFTRARELLRARSQSALKLCESARHRAANTYISELLQIARKYKRCDAAHLRKMAKIQMEALSWSNYLVNHCQSNQSCMCRNAARPTAKRRSNCKRPLMVPHQRLCKTPYSLLHTRCRLSDNLCDKSTHATGNTIRS